MNEDEVIGTLVKLVGKAQTNFGSFINNKKQINEGIRKQIFGEAQSSYGKACEAVKHARRN